MIYLYLFLITIYFILTSLFELQMLQQNSYNDKNKFYLFLKKDIKNNYQYYLLKYLFALSLLLFDKFNTLIHFYFVIIILILLFTSYINYKKHLQKHPLKFTKRIFRIISLDYLFYIVLIILLYKINIMTLLGVSLLYISLNSIILIVIIYILSPVEKMIFNGYKNKAITKLNRMNGIKVIGVTGSFGKTSTKMILNSILNEKYKGFYTPSSYNTPNGVVLTINNEKTIFNDYFICEMGARANGEIKELCDIVSPKYGIITSIGPAHLESFKSLDNICKTKFELLESLPNDGIIVLNKDDKYQKKYKYKGKAKVVWISLKNKADYYADNIKISSEGTKFDICYGKNKITVSTVLLGEKNIYNILSSVALAYELGLNDNEIINGVKNIAPIAHRLEIKHHNNITIIDDSFNSNPEGASAALDALKLMDGKKVIITPGMIEMGDKEYDLNFEFGKKIANICDEIYLIGKKQTLPIKEGILKINKDANINVYNRFIDTYNDIIRKSGNKKEVILIENDLPDSYTEE